MRQTRAFALAVVTTAALGVAACGSDDDASTSTGGAAASTGASTSGDSGGKPVDVAYVTYAYTDYVQAEEKGLKAAVEPDGGSVRVFNANFDPQKLVQQCQDAISSGRYDGILLAPVDSPSGKPCAAAAKAADMPVVTIENPVGDDPTNIEPQVPGVVGVVSLSIPRNAESIAGLTTKACADKDPCKIIAELAFPSDPLTTAVVKRVKSDVPNAEIVQTIVGQYDPSVIAKAFPDALAANPDTDVFVSAADSQALAVVPALEQAGKLGQVELIGSGGSHLGKKAIEDGTMFGTIGNWPEQSGEAAGKMLIQAANGEPVEPNSIDGFSLDTPVIVDESNVDQFTPEWGAQRPE